MPHRIKLLQVLNLAGWGGAPQVVFDICSNLDKNLFDIHIACGRHQDISIMKQLEKDGVRIIPLACLKRNPSIINDIITFFTLYGLIRKNRYDVIHCHSSKAGLIGRFAAKMAGVKKIFFTVHGWSFQNEKEFGFYKPLLVLSERIAALFTTKIICISEFIKKLGIDNKIGKDRQYQIIYNGVETNTKTPIKRDLDIITFGMVSRLSYPKEPLLFLKSAKIIAERYQKSRFILIGDGNYYKDCKEFIENHNLSSQIELLGFKNPDELKSLQKTFDVGVLVTQFEGLGLSILQTMGLGLPVICSDTGGLKEIVISSTNGLLVDNEPIKIAQAMEYFLKNPDKINDMGLLAYQRVIQKFPLTIMVGAYLKLYQESTY